MASDWNKREDQQPGQQLIRQQPEATTRGLLWTQLIEIDWPCPVPSRTQLIVREWEGKVFIDHGRIFPLVSTHVEDDSA